MDKLLLNIAENDPESYNRELAGKAIEQIGSAETKATYESGKKP